MPTNTIISIKEGTKCIADNAFFSCSGLSSIMLPNSVTYIGNRAFKDCSNLISINIPNNVLTIKAYSFQGCSSLTSITIPNLLSSIPNGAFSGCSSLSSITVPNSVESIGSCAFEGTAWFNSQPEGVVYVGSVLYQYKGAMPANTILSIKDGTKSITAYAFSRYTELSSVIIPNTVISIGYGAFQECSGLTSVTIPNSVTSMEQSVFSGCSSLSSFIIPTGLTTINDNMFSGCSSLSNISIPNSVTRIGSSAFSHCSELPSIVIPTSVAEIGSSAFSNCSSLASISIPEGVKIIDGDAFRECISLTSVDIPNSVTSIGTYAFGECTGLASVSLGNGVASIGSLAFYDCQSLANISFPEGLTSIGEDAFWGTQWYEKQPNGLLYINHVFYEYKDVMPENTKLELKNGTLGIAGGAFRNAWDRLVSIVIPESVVCIGERAFGECRGLTSITIPQNVESIGMMAFYNCTNLDSVITKIKEPYEIDGTIFSVFDEETISDLFTSSTLYVPKGTKDKYAKTYCWNKFREVVEIEIAEESNDTLSASDLQTLAGTKVVLPIELKNENEVKLCQFDLQLPNGVTVTMKSNGKLDVKLTERAENHSVSSTQLANGDYRFIISSMDNDSFMGNEGTLVEITLDVAETMEAGEYTVKVLNTELSVPDGNDLLVVRPADTESVLTVETYTPGDVNNDGTVSVTDVGCAINYILEQIPSVFIFEAADMNDDKSISVTDVGMIINLILNEGSASRSERNDMGTDEQEGNDTGMDDLERNLNNENNFLPEMSLRLVTDGYEVLLENKEAFVGFQLDVHIGDEAVSVQLTGGDDHLLTCRKLSNSWYRVVCYSPTNSTFVAGDMPLAIVHVVGNASLRYDSDAAMLGSVAYYTNIRLTTAGLDEVRLADMSAMTTGIADAAYSQSSEVQVYRLDGRHCRTVHVQPRENPLKGLKSGVYMIGNRKVVLK